MRVFLIVLLIAACGDDGGSFSECIEGMTRQCYTGPDGTEGIGDCKSGLETCSGGKWPGVCLGDVTPFIEQCNGKDENCNGTIDDAQNVGDQCTGSNGCDGERACNSSGKVVCIAPVENECGRCGGATVSGLGSECPAGGCVGTLICTSDLNSAECSAPSQNACAVCGGPAVTGLGTTCSSTDSCTGMMVCNSDGSAAVCNAPMKNECMLCGGPALPLFNMTCTANGCTGTNVCNTAGDALVCNAPLPNECGLCGGPPVTGVGDVCTDTGSNCPSQLVCNTAKTGTVCGTVTRNECNLCGGPPVIGLTATCTGDKGCLGVGVCNATNDALSCQLDSPCVHVVISEIATGVTGCTTNEYIELYNPSNRTVSLAGYALRHRQATLSTYTKLLAFASTATIAPRGFYLVASAQNGSGTTCIGGYTGAGNSVTADATWTGPDMSGSTGASIWLTSADQDPTGPTDVKVVDFVGYGTANAFEGTAAITPTTAGSYERKANATSTSATMATAGADVTAGNGYDTDDNVANFVRHTSLRVPQNTASAVEP